MISLSIDSLLLRGCIIKNTDWLFALVIFTGKQCKLMLNNRPTSFKRSNIDKK